MVEEDEGILGESGPRWMLDDPPRASQATRSPKKKKKKKKKPQNTSQTNDHPPALRPKTRSDQKLAR